MKLVRPWVHGEIHNCRNQMTEVLSGFAEKTVLFVSSGLHFCQLLFFHEMGRNREKIDWGRYH